MSTQSHIQIGSPVFVKTSVVLSPVELSGGSTASTASLWTGEGPPHLVIGASVGDEYYDALTGNLYRLDPGE